MNNLIADRRTFLKTSLLAGAGVISSPLFAAQAREVPWLPEIQQPPAMLPADAPKLNDLLVDERGNPITTLDAWQRRRQELRRWWLDFLGPMPAERKAAPKLTVIEEDRVEGVARQLVRYEIEPGIETEAYLLLPEKQTGKAAGIAVFHSTVNYTIRQPAGW